MPRRADDLDLDVDLQGGVVPISKAASSLAALIKRGRERRQPIIVTQKGYPTGVILPIGLFTALRELAERADGSGTDEATLPPQAAETAPTPEPVELIHVEPEAPVVEPEPPTQRRGRSRRKAAQAVALAPAELPAEPTPPEPAPAEPGKLRGRGGRKARAQA